MRRTIVVPAVVAAAIATTVLGATAQLFPTETASLLVPSAAPDRVAAPFEEAATAARTSLDLEMGYAERVLGAGATPAAFPSPAETDATLETFAYCITR